MSSHTPDSSNKVEEQKSVLNKKDRQMFMELGLTASTNFLPWEGHALFGQLLLADPEAAYPRIGLAYCKIMGGQFADAHKLLKNKIVESSPLRDYGMALRGFAFHLAKEPQELDLLFKDNKDSLQDNTAAFSFFQTLLTSLS